jgi:hypothetical protein
MQNGSHAKNGFFHESMTESEREVALIKQDWSRIFRSSLSSAPGTMI